MAKHAVTSTRVYLDQYNLSGDLNGWTQKVDQETIVVTTISDAGPRRLVGNYDYNDDYTGFFDGVDNGIDEIVNALIGSASDHFYGKVLGASISGGLPAEASIAYEEIAHLVNEPLSGQVGGAVLLNISQAGANGICRGVVLRAVAAVGASNGTGRNLGATTSGQVFQAVYRILAFNGTNITVAVEQSTDDGGADAYAGISGMTETFTTTGVARDTTTAATEAWKRIAITGTFTTATVLVTVGTVAGT